VRSRLHASLTLGALIARPLTLGACVAMVQDDDESWGPWGPAGLLQPASTMSESSTDLSWTRDESVTDLDEIFGPSESADAAAPGTPPACVCDLDAILGPSESADATAPGMPPAGASLMVCRPKPAGMPPPGRWSPRPSRPRSRSRERRRSSRSVSTAWVGPLLAGRSDPVH